MNPRASRRNRPRGAPAASDAPLADALNRVPGWVPPVFFAVLTLFLFRSFVFSREMLFGVDTMSLGYQARLFFAEALQSTGFPLWNPHILGGTPFIESLAGGDSLHPLSVALFYIFEPYRALGWKLVIHVFLAGIFMFGWLRMLGCSRGAALVGGTGALLAPSFVTLVFPGHDGKMFVVAMTPLLFWLAEWIWHRKDLVPGALLALSIGTVLFSTHFQMAYFLFGALGAWMIFRAIQVGRSAGWKVGARGFSIFMAFSLLGAGTAAIQLLPAVSYVSDFSRRASTTVGAESPEAARAYSSSWSLHPEEALSLLVPEFVGSSSGGAEWTTETYWGRNAFKLNHEYLGAVLLLLALLALVPGAGGAGVGSSAPSPAPVPASGPAPGVPSGPPSGPGPAGRWFLAGLALVAALFALGANTPVWRIFYEVLPGISLFRAPSMAIFLTAFAVSTLAALGLDRAAHLLETEEGRRIVLRWTGGGAAVLAVGGILAASGILVSVWEAVVYTDLPGSRVPALESLHPHMVLGFFTVAALTGALAGTFWAAGRGKLAAPLVLTAVTALVVVDLVRVDAPFIQVVDPARVTLPDPNLRFLEARTRDEPPFRVFSMARNGQDVQPSAFGIDLAAGHHPNDLGRYRELIGMEGSGIPTNLATFHPVVMAILNVRYVLWPDAEYGALDVEPVNQVQLADGRSFASVYPYPGLPRARLVGSYRQVGEGEALAILLEDEGFDPRVEVVLEDTPPLEPEPRADGTPHPPGAVRWLEEEPDRLVLDVEVDQPSLLVVSQNWFPSWVARVDGELTPVLRADHALQAVAIPAGQHRVELAVESTELRQALLLSGFSLLVVLGAGLVSGLSAGRTTRERGPKA